MKKYCLIILLLFLCVFLYGKSAHAANFSLSFITEYQFDERGTANVKKTVTLSNLSTNTYPSVYFVDLPPDAENVVAFDTQGKTKTAIIEENNKKKLKVNPNNETVGFGNKVTIAVSYRSNSLAKNTEGNWRIDIPGFSTQEDISLYKVSVAFPEIWGIPSQSIPPYDTPYTWIFTQRTDLPITVSFNEPTPIPVRFDKPSLLSIPTVAGVSFGIVIFAFLIMIAKKIV